MGIPENPVVEHPKSPPGKPLSVQTEEAVCTRSATSPTEEQPKTVSIVSTRLHHPDALLSIFPALVGIIGFLVAAFWNKCLVLVTYKTPPAPLTVPPSPNSDTAVCDITPLPQTTAPTKERKRRLTPSENPGIRASTRRKSWTKPRNQK